MSSSASDFLFRFDASVDRVVFGGEVVVEGWLIHREGKEIHGIRAVVSRRLRRSEIFRARRKRNRPDVAAAYPDLANAGASGFRLDVPLRIGSNTIDFQVQDHDREWRTFHSSVVTSLPISALGYLGFPNVRDAAIARLKGPHTGDGFAPASAPLPLRRQAPLRRASDVASSSSRITRVRLFATSKSNLFIIEIGALVAAGFRELSCETDLLIDQLPEKNPREDTLQIVVTPHEFYNLFVSNVASRAEARSLTQNVVLLCTEQPETAWFQSNLRWAADALAVADINPLGVAAYRARDLRCHRLALGYHDMLAHAELPPHAARKLDITFLGSLTPRRDEFFAHHAAFFSEHECHLRLVPLGFAKTEATNSYLTNARRNELLSQSRILLNVHYSEQKYFEWHRMLVGLANGCCIITETCHGHGQLVPGEHFIMVEPEQLISCCEYYLNHPDECARIAAAGAEFIRTNLRQAEMCAAFLRGMTAGEESACVLSEIDAQPHALPADAVRVLAKHERRPMRDALVADLRRLSKKFSRSSKPVLETETPMPIASDLRQGIIQKREGYRRRWLDQESARSRGEPFVTIYDQDGAAAAETPTLTVLITLYNYGQFIEECVASVERAVAQLEYATEVLIVNDASTDDSLARALRCQKKFSLPIRVIDKNFNTGLADARNVGVSLSRAEYVFMLDADNLVFPSALKQLIEVIRTGDHAAAYGMLCRFRGTPANRLGLLSYFDWDPEILVQYPYIDAMAMFRRAALLDGSGYNNDLSQIGWFGWEDYDLWLRFASTGRSVGFVPNILCLYRHHETSMINTTNLFEAELGRHFIENYATLLERYPARERIFGLDRHRILEAETLSSRGGNAG
ncbi:MAG: glycosyltransferase [Verrucomicrobiota bacterium]|nr:glycosyltransferase [Verrucomicrobiota bacterium]